MKPYFILLVLLYSVSSAQTSPDNYYRFQVGTTIYNLPDRQSEYKSFSYQYILNTTLKYYCTQSNSINLYCAVASKFTSLLINYPADVGYRYSEFEFILGYEHAFFAKRKFNFLASPGLEYTFRPVPADLGPGYLYGLSNISIIGAGLNLGFRYNINKRFALESNFGAYLVKPINDVYKNDINRDFGNPYTTAFAKFLSLDFNYRFNLPKKK